MSEIAEKKALSEVERILGLEFPDAAPGIITAAVQQAHTRFASSRIRDYIPLFVEKHAREQLSRSSTLADSA